MNFQQLGDLLNQLIVNKRKKIKTKYIDFELIIHLGLARRQLRDLLNQLIVNKRINHEKNIPIKPRELNH